MKTTFTTGSHRAASSAGLTLIELMIAMAISLLMLLALVTLFVNTSRTNSEMAKTNDLIDDGRISIQLLADDLAHAGYWGGYLPEFDDLTFSGAPGDAPSAVPNPCTQYSDWDSAYRNNILGIAVQGYEALPSGPGCVSPLSQRANTDVLVVRHLETCLPGVGTCDAYDANKLYFQSPLCEAERNGTAQDGTINTITLASDAATADNAYDGLTLHTLSGTGAGQYRVISNYDGSNRRATVSPDWGTAPDNTTVYALEYRLGVGSFPLHKVDCSTLADRRKFVSNVYYVSDVVRNGVTIPTLVRSQFDLAGGSLAQQTPVKLIEGVEAFRVELGIDNISDSGAAVNYANAIVWSNPATKTSPTNRGDGAPDSFVRCTTAAPCTVAQLSNVVAVKLYVLTRSREPTPGYTDAKTYCLGEPANDGSCPLANTISAANDNFKRHVFTTSVRLVNISGRRETPP